MSTRSAEDAAFGRGYQEALEDIAFKLAEGGEPAVREWLHDNVASANTAWLERLLTARDTTTSA